MPSALRTFTINTSLALLSQPSVAFTTARRQDRRTIGHSRGPAPRFVRQSRPVRPTFPDRSAALIIELLRTGKPARFKARGGSMWPMIPGGSLVEVTPGTPKAAGELVAFERAGQVVIHRVLRIMVEGVVTRGDALDATDGVIARSRVLGTARVLERRRSRVRMPSLRELRIALRAAWRRVTG